MAAIVQIKRLQIVIEPLRSATSGHHRQIGRWRAEPLLGKIRLHGRGHLLADLLTGEDQLLQRECVRHTQIVSRALVALVLKRVAAQAVIHVKLPAILQRRQILQIR